MSCGLGCRRSLDPVLLWLWHRPAAMAPTGPLAFEPPYTAGAALEKAKRQKKKKGKWIFASCGQRRNIQRLCSLEGIFLRRQNTLLSKSMNIFSVNDQRGYLNACSAGF